MKIRGERHSLGEEETKEKGGGEVGRMKFGKVNTENKPCITNETRNNANESREKDEQKPGHCSTKH